MIQKIADFFTRLKGFKYGEEYSQLELTEKCIEKTNECVDVVNANEDDLNNFKQQTGVKFYEVNQRIDLLIPDMGEEPARQSDFLNLQGEVRRNKGELEEKIDGVEGRLNGSISSIQSAVDGLSSATGNSFSSIDGRLNQLENPPMGQEKALHTDLLNEEGERIRQDGMLNDKINDIGSLSGLTRCKAVNFQFQSPTTIVVGSVTVCFNGVFSYPAGGTLSSSSFQADMWVYGFVDKNTGVYSTKESSTEPTEYVWKVKRDSSTNFNPGMVTSTPNIGKSDFWKMMNKFF